MKRIAMLVALFAASSVIAADSSAPDDADEDQTPVTTITPVSTAPVAAVAPVQTTWTLQPVAVALISVLADPAPSPAQIKALVAQLSVSDLAKVVAAVAGNPTALSALVTQLTPSQLAKAVVALQGTPSAITALVATMSADQSAKVVAELSGDSRALTVVLAKMDPAKLNLIQIQLFLTDVDAWEAVSGFLNQPQPQKPFANWLETSRARLAARIAQSGYTPELLTEAQQLMQQATEK